MVTLAVPAAAAAPPLVASLRRSNGVQLQDGGRVTSVMVVLPAASNFNLSLASLHNGTGIHQHRWPVVLHISPSLTTPPRFFTISLMILCCQSFCFFGYLVLIVKDSLSSSCDIIW
jgi:hypothetical protein